MEPVSQEQVLDHEVVALANKGCQGGEEDAEWLKHPGRVGWPIVPDGVLPSYSRSLLGA